MLSIATKMFARVEDAVHRLCSCSSFSGSRFRLFFVKFLFITFALVGKASTLPFQREQQISRQICQYLIAGRPQLQESGLRMQQDSYSVQLLGRSLSVVILPVLFISFCPPFVYVLEDAVRRLCSCSSFSGSWSKGTDIEQSEKCDLHSEFLNHVLVRPKQTACDILILQTILALVALCGIVYVFFCAIG